MLGTEHSTTMPSAMRPVWIRTALFACLLYPVSALWAQAPEPPPSLPPPTPTVEVSTLGRDVPRGAVRGLVEACEHGDFDEAATYLNLRRPSKAIGKIPAPSLARDFCAVLDRKLWVNLNLQSDSPEGNENDGLPRGTDSLGSIATEDGQVPILIERIREQEGHPWLVAAATVTQIPRLYAEFGYGPLGHLLPPIFLELRFRGVQLWQWLGLLVLLPAAWLLSRPLTSLLSGIARAMARRTKTAFDDALVHNAAGPIRLILAAVIVDLGAGLLALGVRSQAAVSGGRQLVSVIALAWLVFRLSDVFASMIVERQRQAATFMPLGRRTVKAFAVAIAMIATLHWFGFDVSSLLAGLGIGGLAVALAAQKTVEHLFGGVTLVADQPIRVGDLCKFGGTSGVVEDIGLRSTRIRTADRTVISVPNGEFSGMQIENFSRRDRMRLKTILGLRYETTADQLRFLLAEIHALALATRGIDEDSVNVRFVQFGAYSLDIELNAYVKTTNADEFAKVREDLFLRIMDLIDAAGSGFAFPSQTIYAGKDPGVDTSKQQAVLEQLRQRSTDGDP